jgi:hypothetical protein
MSRNYYQGQFNTLDSNPLEYKSKPLEYLDKRTQAFIPITENTAISASTPIGLNLKDPKSSDTLRVKVYPNPNPGWECLFTKSIITRNQNLKPSSKSLFISEEWLRGLGVNSK